MRYYYDCPLKAAWMHKHFGMRFDVYEPVFEIDGFSFAYIDRADGYEFSEGQFIYIHPESLRLLEPQVGDLVLWLGHIVGTICNKIFTEYTDNGKKEFISIEPVLVEGAIESSETNDIASAFRPMTKFDHGKAKWLPRPEMKPCRIMQRNDIPFMWPESEE